MMKMSRHLAKYGNYFLDMGSKAVSAGVHAADLP